METTIDLKSVHRAFETRDPDVAELLRILNQQAERPPKVPVRDGAMTFEKFIAEIQSPAFRKRPQDEQERYRRDQIAALESDDAEVPLSDQLRSHDVILKLWNTDDEFSRTALLRVIKQVPLRYGPWKALKTIFKDAEASNDTEILGALIARFDAAMAARSHGVSQNTMAYLCRRGWRYLRRLGETMPAVYPDICSDVLANYDDETNWRQTWVANHIFYHETGEYGRGRFRFKSRPSTLLKHRAFQESWRRTPRPLFTLLERAHSEQVRKFATSALKTDFRTTLRDVEAVWVARLVYVESGTIDEFVVWILNNVPKFEQASFRDLGLHDPVLKLCDSSNAAAAAYAAEYIRTHARDLDVDSLIRLVNSNHKPVSKVAHDLLRERDPRKDVGLDAWGRLLDSKGSNLAIKVLREHFGSKELTQEWFRDRLLGKSQQAFEFAAAELIKIHKLKDLQTDYFLDLIETIDDETDPAVTNRVAPFALRKLEEFDLNAIASERLQRLILHPCGRVDVANWIHTGRLSVRTFPMSFLKAAAFHPDWNEDPWVTELRRSVSWARRLEFNETLSEQILSWMKDVREFSPVDLGFEWLMKLVQRSEPRYHDFAVDTMSKAFLPADFADDVSSGATAEPEAKSDADITVDLGGQSFLFTGKLATMTRSEAQAKVTKAGGANASTVSAKLDYLVIGDEGSPLYGEGRKGSKQVKAESLRDGGADVKIISETAFLQMLSGEQREFSDDAINAGCERLWSMMLDNDADHPLSQFARVYLRRHHPDICLAETDRPVDPGAEIPNNFLTFDRLKTLYHDKRGPVREYAMELAKWEFARWAPPIEGIIQLCESPFREVRDFVAQALTADEHPEHRRYRVDPAVLTADAVYSFCESRDEGTRALGMQLIDRNPRLRLPEELFRLTESPDRNVRAFAVRAFWSLYRDRGITAGWKPTIAKAAPSLGQKAKQKAEDAARNAGEGAPERPGNLPAALDDLTDFLRRALFEIPPGPPEKTPGRLKSTLKPLPARKAKLLLIETLRDLSLMDAELAGVTLPLLMQFMLSKGKSEMEACLVAVTMIRNAQPQLNAEATNDGGAV
ncbi:MAG: BRCT domain-containing protein [Planctomycetaceae bacterium]